MGKRHSFVDEPARTRTCANLCVIRASHLTDCTGDAEHPCTGCVPYLAASDRHALCDWCNRALIRWLGDLPAALDSLHSGLAPSNRPGSGTHSKLSGSPDFARSRATVQLVNEAVTFLAAWCREVAPTVTLTPPADPLKAAQRFCSWLTSHDEAVILHQGVTDRMDTLRTLRSRTRRQTDPPPRNRFALPTEGRCPGKGEPCGAELHATLFEEGDGRTNSIWCAGEDRHEFATWEWRRLIERLGYGPMQVRAAEQVAEAG